MPDALFCHRCGRPLRPLIAEEEASETEAPLPVEPEPDRLGRRLAARRPAHRLQVHADVAEAGGADREGDAEAERVVVQARQS